MFTILIPILACLAGMQATKAGQDFKEPVTVQFVIKDWEHTAKNYGWRDWSTYESPELKELGTIPDAVGDVVGSLVFKHADDPDAHRVITWIKDKSDKTLRQCLVSLSENPETLIITVELSPDSSKESVGEYKGFHLDCGEEIQSAAGGYPVTVPTSAAPSSIAAPQPTISSLPFNSTLLVNFMANPANLADPKEGGWYDHTDYNKMYDLSAGLLDDNDKKPPSMPQNNDTRVLLGQIKFEGASNVPRLYSWMPKIQEDKPLNGNCNLTIGMDPHVSEIWVWADTDKVEAKVKGEEPSKEKLEEYKSEAIKAKCNPK